jgi:hypothetical protein
MDLKSSEDSRRRLGPFLYFTPCRKHFQVKLFVYVHVMSIQSPSLIQCRCSGLYAGDFALRLARLGDEGAAEKDQELRVLDWKIGVTQTRNCLRSTCELTIC